jgi:transposase
MNRVEKLLEDAQIKLGTVASKLFTLSGRAMLDALVAGERDPKRLAQLARTRMRTKIPALEEALTGRFTEHHTFLLRRMLARIDAASADIAALDEKIEAAVAPYASLIARLDEIPGVGQTTAQVLLAEIGPDATRFPTAGHLASWAKFTPITRESAGRRKGRDTTGRGNRYLAGALGEAAAAAAKTSTFLGARHRRLARRGKKKAIVATGRAILTVIWHLLSNPDAHFRDLGADYFDRALDPDRARRTHVRALEAQGFTVTLTPAA